MDVHKNARFSQLHACRDQIILDKTDSPKPLTQTQTRRDDERL